MELKTKNEEHMRQLTDLTNQRARFQAENGILETFCWLKRTFINIRCCSPVSSYYHKLVKKS